MPGPDVIKPGNGGRLVFSGKERQSAVAAAVLAGLGWTCTRVDMGYICGCIALVAGVLKYRNIIQFNSLTVQRFRNTYKDEMDLNKYNKYVDSHF